MRRIRIVQPKVILCARQHARELDLVADESRGDRGVWQWIAVRRKVVQAIGGIVLAQVAGYLDDHVRCAHHLNEVRGKDSDF